MLNVRSSANSLLAGWKVPTSRARGVVSSAPRKSIQEIEIAGLVAFGAGDRETSPPAIDGDHGGGSFERSKWVK